MKDIRTLILEASAVLKDRGVADPDRESRILMCFALEKDDSFLRGHPEYVLNDREHGLFVKSVKRRGKGEPFQHIAGKQEFYGLDFIVNQDVLVPRQETELIVEEALKQFSDRDDLFFCDIGTGSGCIAVSLLANLLKSSCIATDISESAIAIAGLNAGHHGVGDRFSAVISDVFEAMAPEPLFDLIVANPPYVPKKDLANLQIEVRLFDPEVALTDGGDGISILRRIESSAYSRLKSKGILLMEFGFGQHEMVVEIFKRGPWESIDVRTDLRGIPVSFAQKNLRKNHEFAYNFWRTVIVSVIFKAPNKYFRNLFRQHYE